MPIRRRLAVRRKIEYHRQYGSLSQPPARGGIWPCGSELIKLVGRKTLLLGYVIRRADHVNHGTFGISSASEAMLLMKALVGKSEPIVETALNHYVTPPAQHAAWASLKEVERISTRTIWGTTLPAYVPVKRERGYAMRKWRDDFDPVKDIKYLGEFSSKVLAEEALTEFYEDKFDTVL